MGRERKCVKMIMTGIANAMGDSPNCGKGAIHPSDDISALGGAITTVGFGGAILVGIAAVGLALVGDKAEPNHHQAPSGRRSMEPTKAPSFNI
jgi:hypothetical protein